MIEPHMEDSALRTWLKQLNEALIAYKKADSAMKLAQCTSGNNTIIHYWYARKHAEQRYMEAWQVLVEFGDIQFSHQSGTFLFFAKCPQR
ncbi:MAG TPA: hypothetical protein VH593_20745 [Ktedonobacteraceae bacterium]